MKILISFFALLANTTSYGSVECSAPESVAQVAEQIELTFDGSTISCDDGNQFTSNFTFECKGDKFYNIKDPDDLTTRADGSKVYVITVLSEQSDKIVMEEQVYSDYSDYQDDGSPLESSESNFIPMSKRSFAFYSQQEPGAKTFLMSTWFIPEDHGKTRGYKVFADKVVFCKAN